MSTIIETKEELDQYKIFFKANVLQGDDKHRRALCFGCYKIHKTEDKAFFEYVKVRGLEVVPILAGLFRELRNFNPAADEWIKTAVIKSRKQYKKCGVSCAREGRGGLELSYFGTPHHKKEGVKCTL